MVEVTVATTKWTVHSLRNEILSLTDPFWPDDWHKPKWRVAVANMDDHGAVTNRYSPDLFVTVSWQEGPKGEEQKKLVASIPGFVRWGGRGWRRRAHFMRMTGRWECECGKHGAWTTEKKAKQGKRMHMFDHNKEQHNGQV